MKKNLLFYAIIVVGFSLSFCFAQEENSFIGIVNTGDVNVRAGANINFEIITKLNRDELVEVLDKTFNWYKIKLPKDLSCFVGKDYVVSDDQNSGRITANSVNLRTRPNINSTILGQLNKDDKVIILGKKNDWYEIVMPQICFGWVNIKYISYYSKNDGIKISEEKDLKEKKTEKIILKPQEAPAVATGVIKFCGNFFKRPGTHKLIKENKVIYFLKGDRSLLDNFVDYKVNVWGKVNNLPHQNIPLIIVERISVQE